MHQIHPDASLVPLLKRLLDNDINIRLYNNDVTPDENSVLGDFNEMVPGTGYTTKTVTLADFTSEGVASHIGTISGPPVAWTITPDGTNGPIYGYFITDTSLTYLLACARFDDAPISITAGAIIQVTPILGGQSRFLS